MRLSEEEATRATEIIKGVILHAPLAASEACPNDPQELGEIIHRHKVADVLCHLGLRWSSDTSTHVAL